MYDKPCCYFYIEDDGTVAYVGKANGTLKQRVYSHSKEEKFDCAHKNYTIKFVEFDRASDMDVAEKCYIKSLKPRLNVIDNTAGFFPKVEIDFESLPTYEVNKKRKANSKSEIIRIQSVVNWEPCNYPLSPKETYRHVLITLSNCRVRGEHVIKWKTSEEKYLINSVLWLMINKHEIELFRIYSHDNSDCEESGYYYIDCSHKMQKDNAIMATCLLDKIDTIDEKIIRRLMSGNDPVVLFEWRKERPQRYMEARCKYANSFDANRFINDSDVAKVSRLNYENLIKWIKNAVIEYGKIHSFSPTKTWSIIYKRFDKIVKYPTGDRYKAEDVWDYSRSDVQYFIGGRFIKMIEWDKLMIVLIHCILSIARESDLCLEGLVA